MPDMLSGPMFKPLLFTAAIAALSTCLWACQADDVTYIDVSSTGPASNMTMWPTLSERLGCLPEEGVLLAAHRGTAKKRGLAENALESLKALYEGGIRVAEIDVAQLQSGEHILFHDGVWEEKSTGQGAVAQSRWLDVKDYLLRDTDGGLTASRPIKLIDVLSYARGRLHLEIDFKSSADYRDVIAMIRGAKMAEDVVLIAYSSGQAKALARLAPDMHVSVSVKNRGDIKALEKSGVKKSQMMGWIGKSEDRTLQRYLESQNIPVLAQEAGRRAPFIEADIFVTDYGLSKTVFDGAMGLSASGKADYKSCLSGL